MSFERYAWMADHVDDLEADFLAIYGLDQTRLDGPRWVRLAQRIGAYGGVMARRIEQQHDGEQPAANRTAPGGGVEQEITLAELRMTHPGLVSVTRASE